VVLVLNPRMTWQRLFALSVSPKEQVACLLVDCSCDPRSSLVSVLDGGELFGRLLGAGLRSSFQLIGLALRFIEFGALLCHSPSFAQPDKIG
jgi:hypothetical protein